MEVEMKVTGLKEAIEQLQTLASPKAVQAIIKSSMREGLKPIKEDAARRLGKRGRISTGTQRISTWGAGVVAKFGIGVVGKHWQEIFREYGTIERYTKKGGYRGKIKKNPFIRPAVDSQLNKATDKIIDHLQSEVERVIIGRQKGIATFKDYEEIT